jgi:hypothetical protein
MKPIKTTLALLFLVLNFSLFAQTISIRGENGKVIYTDVQNVIFVESPGYDISQIFITIYGKKYSGSMGKFTFSAPDFIIGDEVKVYVSSFDNAIETQLGETTFLVKQKYGATLSIGNFYTKDTLTSEQFMQLDSLFCSDKKLRILKFSCATVPLKKPAEFFLSNGNKLSEALKNSVLKMESKGKIIFDEIIVINNTGEKIKANPVILILR